MQSHRPLTQRKDRFLTDDEDLPLAKMSLKRIADEPVPLVIPDRPPQPEINKKDSNEEQVVEEMRKLIKDTRAELRKQ